MATSETLIDIGANLSHPAFKHDVRQVVEYARKHAGVERALLTTAYLKKHDALRNFQLCDEHRGFRCTLESTLIEPPRNSTSPIRESFGQKCVVYSSREAIESPP